MNRRFLQKTCVLSLFLSTVKLILRHSRPQHTPAQIPLRHLALDFYVEPAVNGATSPTRTHLDKLLQLLESTGIHRLELSRLCEIPLIDTSLTISSMRLLRLDGDCSLRNKVNSLRSVRRGQDLIFYCSAHVPNAVCPPIDLPFDDSAPLCRILLLRNAFERRGGLETLRIRSASLLSRTRHPSWVSATIQGPYLHLSSPRRRKRSEVDEIDSRRRI